MTQLHVDISELVEITQNLTKYMLNNSVTKIPVKRADIVAHALRGNAKIFVQAIRAAKEQLLEYGFELHEVEDAKIKQYILTSELTAESIHEYTPKQRANLTLLFLILSLIFMKGCSVSETALYKFLRCFNIDTQDPHPFFGDNLKKLIGDTFVKQLYLKKERSELDAGTEPETMYSWGFRSTIEFPKKDVLEQVSELFGKRSLCFVQQYREAYGELEQDVEMVEE